MVEQGWYPNPTNSEEERWWDGEKWTETVRLKEPGKAGISDRTMLMIAAWLVLGVFLGAAALLLSRTESDSAVVAENTSQAEPTTTLSTVESQIAETGPGLVDLKIDSISIVGEPGEYGSFGAYGVCILIEGEIASTEDGLDLHSYSGDWVSSAENCDTIEGVDIDIFDGSGFAVIDSSKSGNEFEEFSDLVFMEGLSEIPEILTFDSLMGGLPSGTALEEIEGGMSLYERNVTFSAGCAPSPEVDFAAVSCG